MHSLTHTHTHFIDSETDPAPSSIARISTSDGRKLPSKPGPGGVQTVCYSSEPDTRVQVPAPCLLNSLFCHFQSQFVTLTWFSSLVPCHRGVGKKGIRGTTENMQSVYVAVLVCQSDKLTKIDKRKK